MSPDPNASLIEAAEFEQLPWLAMSLSQQLPWIFVYIRAVLHTLSRLSFISRLLRQHQFKHDMLGLNPTHRR